MSSASLIYIDLKHGCHLSQTVSQILKELCVDGSKLYPDFFFLSVYKNRWYRGLQLNNHLEIFPVKILCLSLISCPCDSGEEAWQSHLSKHINNRAGSYWPSLLHA